MPWSTWKRLVQKKNGQLFFSPYSKRLPGIYYWPLWRSVIGRDTISVLAPVLGPWQKKKLCHPLPLFMAVSMIVNTAMWHSSCWCMRHSWLTKFGVLCLNKLVPGAHLKYGPYYSTKSKRQPCMNAWYVAWRIHLWSLLLIPCKKKRDRTFGSNKSLEKSSTAFSVFFCT